MHIKETTNIVASVANDFASKSKTFLTSRCSFWCVNYTIYSYQKMMCDVRMRFEVYDDKSYDRI